MAPLARKLETFGRIARTQGVAGVFRVATYNYARRYARYYARLVPGYTQVEGLARALAVMPEALAVRRAHTAPGLALAFFGGIGDELLLTVVTRELRRREYHGTWVMSEYGDVWQGNDDPDLVLPWDRRHSQWAERFGWNVVYPYYTRYRPNLDRDVPPRRHILRLMCEQAGIVGPIDLKPHLTLTADERDRGALVPNQIAIQSAGLHARFAVRTKQWFPERFQEVVAALSGDFTFVQIGSRSDPPLRGALDLRGETSIRETAAILARSLAFVGQVGMLMHLARAVDCRSVIVYGGREHPRQTGYSCNENLYSAVPCAPCWKLNRCGHRMACMREIAASDVVRAVERQIARRGEPLVTDVDVATADEAPASTTPDGRTMLQITDVFGRVRPVEAKFAPRWPDETAPVPKRESVAA